MTQPVGEVFDIGYQRYEGPREGRNRARKALWTNGLRSALGIGRGGRAKILPALLFIGAMLPALIFVLIVAVVGIAEFAPGHDDYYQIVSIVIILFSAIIAPELLCPDRRSGVIHLYLVRPLTALDYAGGRWLAFFSISLAIIYSGQVLLFVGLTLASDSPLTYVQNNWLDVLKFLLAGVVLAAFTTTLPMAVAAFTTRRALAAAFVIGLFIVSVPVANGLTAETCDISMRPDGTVLRENCRRLTGEAAPWLALLDLGLVPTNVNRLIFGESEGGGLGQEEPSLATELPDVVPVAWYVLLTAGPGLLLWWRYQTLKV